MSTERAPDATRAADSGRDVRLETARARPNRAESGVGRARRLAPLDANSPQIAQSADRGRSSRFVDETKKSIMQKSTSDDKTSSGGESDNLQVLFVLSPEHTADSSTSPAKPTE
jgi:hypothetical protein